MASIRLFQLLALVICLTLSAKGRAGNWSGGGGEILEFGQNPWFIEGPRESPPVRYCVIAAPDFSVPIDALEKLAIDSIHWWDNQFSNAYYPDNKVLMGQTSINIKFQVNTSRFIKESCKESTDLSFQFGTLTQDQAAEFQKLQIDLTRFTALTIRTEYSDMLRGKGFIYVSPDRGPNAFRGQNVRKEAWTSNDPQFYRLQSVLTHELGHVFGLGHSGSIDSIMSAKFAESIVSASGAASIENRPPSLQNSVFFPKTGFLDGQFCGYKDELKAFRAYFEIPDAMECVRAHFSLNSLIVEEASDFSASSTWLRVGSAKFADGGDRRHQQLVTLWIPSTQTYFTGLPTFIQTLLGPASSEVQQTAMFTFANTQHSKPIFVQASPLFIQIGGVVENRIVPDLLPVNAFDRAISGWSSR